DHSSVHRWVIKLLPVFEKAFRKRKRPVGKSWRVDETYVKVKGKHPAISSGFLFLGVRAYVSTIRKRTRAHYFPRHFDRAHTADL
ncbi:MAG: putative transposase, partial [Caballeronia sp.]|nr:putative transposase [Caballeronia sp.]